MEGHIHHQFPMDLEEHVCHCYFRVSCIAAAFFLPEHVAYTMSLVTVSHCWELWVLPGKKIT